MKKLCAGIIGCGVMGKLILRLALQNGDLEVKAVADLNYESAASVAHKFGLAASYDDPQKLLEDPDIEAVFLELPTCVRTELALLAFAKGKHVLTEKPFAMNVIEAERLISAKGSLIGACYSSRLRFLPSAKIVKQVIDSGKLGQLRLIRIKGNCAPAKPSQAPPVWRYNTGINGGGLLMNWGCYDLDYIFWLMDWNIHPKSIWAKNWLVPTEFKKYVAPDSDAESHYLAQISCGNDLLISLERGEFVCGQQESYCEIVGAKAGLRFDLAPGKNKELIMFEADSKSLLTKKILWSGDETWESAHIGPLYDFVQAVLQKRSPATSFEQSLLIQTITDQIYASAKSGNSIRI